MKKKYFFLLKILFSIALFFYIFNTINISVLFETLASANLSLYLVSLFFYFFALFLNTYKWKCLVEMMKFEFSYRKLLKLNLSSFFYALFLPGGYMSGEVMKSYKLVRREEEKLLLLVTVFFDKLVGTLSFLITGCLFYTISTFSNEKISLSFFTLFVILIFVFIMLVCPFTRDIAIKQVLKIKKFSALGDKLNKIHNLIDRKYIFKAIGVGVVFQLVLSMAISLILNSLELKINFVDIVWINSLLAIVTMLPISFLGLGVRDISLVFLLSLFGVPAESSVSVSILILSTLVIRGLVGGFFELFPTTKV
jgi:glycosyltransferase 2 family protein